MLEFLNNIWGEEPSRNRGVVQASQDKQPGGIGSLESILEVLKSLNIWAQYFRKTGYGDQNRFLDLSRNQV